MNIPKTILLTAFISGVTFVGVNRSLANFPMELCLHNGSPYATVTAGSGCPPVPEGFTDWYTEPLTLVKTLMSHVEYVPTAGNVLNPDCILGTLPLL